MGRVVDWEYYVVTFIDDFSHYILARKPGKDVTADALLATVKIGGKDDKGY